MTRRLLDYDPMTRITTWHEYYAPDRQNVITSEQDVAPILDANTAIRNHGHQGMIDKEVGLRLVARVPLPQLHQWAAETGTRVGTPEFHEVLRIRLNDPDYRRMRTNDEYL